MSDFGPQNHELSSEFEKQSMLSDENYLSYLINDIKSEYSGLSAGHVCPEPRTAPLKKASRGITKQKAERSSQKSERKTAFRYQRIVKGKGKKMSEKEVRNVIK